MAVELDVFVGNTTILDEDVCQLWLDGFSGEPRAGQCCAPQRQPGPVPQLPDVRASLAEPCQAGPAAAVPDSPQPTGRARGENSPTVSGTFSCYPSGSMAEDSDLAVEKEFLRSPKALRVLITDKDLLDQHKSLVCTALRCEIKVFLEMKANFKSLSRSLINVAAKLTHSKDVRGLSTDLVEKFVELCCSDRWTVGDLWLFLTHYISSAHTPDSFKHRVIWDR